MGQQGAGLLATGHAAERDVIRYLTVKRTVPRRPPRCQAAKRSAMKPELGQPTRPRSLSYWFIKPGIPQNWNFAGFWFTRFVLIMPLDDELFLGPA